MMEESQIFEKESLLPFDKSHKNDPDGMTLSVAHDTLHDRFDSRDLDRSITDHSGKESELV